MDASLGRLIQLLSAGFNNEVQAFENPPLFAHILIKFRPLPQLDLGSLLLEQSYAIDPLNPYRIRVVRIKRENSSLIILNQALREPQRFRGAVESRQRRLSISSDDLLPLKGCTLLVKQNGEGYIGNVEPGCRCLVERQGHKAYLVSSFELDSNSMRTIDRGHDPNTHAQLWGCRAGPFEFQKTVDYSSEIPAHWIEALSR